MAHLFRIALFPLLLFFSAIVSAVILPVPSSYRATSNYSNSNQPVSASSPSAVCSEMNSKMIYAGWTATHTSAYPPHGACAIKDASGNLIQDALIEALGSVCPANSNSNGSGGCTCATNYEEKNGQCVRKPIECPPGQHQDGAVCVPDKCPEGQILINGVCAPDPDLCPDGQKKVNGKCPEPECKKGSTKNLTTAANMPAAFCHKNCLYSAGPPPFGLVCVPDGEWGAGYCTVSYEATGATCNGSDSWPTGPNGGGDPGGSNGGGGGGDPGGSNGGNGGGNGGNGGNTGGNNGTDPDKPKEQIPGTDPDPDTKKCPAGTYKSGGKCYPNAEVTKDPDGSGNCPDDYTKKGNLCIGNKPLPDSDKGKDFCKENPTIDSCKTGSFQGSCTANFKCEGDAIQCAVAREQHKRNCEMFELPNDYSRAFAGISDKTGDQTKDLPGNSEFDISNLIDRSDGLGGGSCIPDLNVNVVGASVTLPFSQICPYLAMLGNILVAVSLLLAGRIITRG